MPRNCWGRWRHGEEDDARLQKRNSSASCVLDASCMHATTDQVHFSTIHRLTYLAVAMMLAGEVSSVCVCVLDWRMAPE